MGSKKVAVVTGGNKGIGYAIVKALCINFEGDVYLTARNVQLGTEAVASLNKLGYKPLFHQLEVTNESDIEKLRDILVEKYGGLDLLINNAAIAFKLDSKLSFGEQAKETIRVNYFGVRKVSDILFPILRPHARVVNFSSSVGLLKIIPGGEIRKQLTADNLDEQKLDHLMEQFVSAASSDSDEKKEWGNTTYGVSKVAINALTVIQQKRFDSEAKTRPGIVVNSVHPGFVDTDMTSHKGPISPDKGAQAPLYASQLPTDVDDIPKGTLIWCDSKTVDWTTYSGEGPRGDE